ncbi:unnamed protein product [Meloidogyne enterolobii]|uniref:Uncharacterized protein n=1 Tax=Meloidogyne enterolobii TaxID=390850 RepID=A0ACB0ZGX5_MELEN
MSDEMNPSNLIKSEEDNEKNQKQNSATKKRFFFTKGQRPLPPNNPTFEHLEKTNEEIVGKEENCAHEIIIKDMCGNCGKDLRIKGGYSGERTEPVGANISMIHHVPELVVSNEVASQLGARDHENILRQRKLILLLDLDQTLVHTSNRPLKPCEAASSTNLFGYQLFGNTFFTKIRPYTHHFLEHINKLYELHIVTFGQRMYAHKIAELLDPNKIYFDYRVLSRDELLSSIHKAGNLKALFPCSEQLVLMLDDRPDVWMHSDALIRLKPYRFFLDVGDINYPLEKENKDSDENKKKNINEKIVEKKEMEKKEKEEKGEESLNQKDIPKSEESEENKKCDEDVSKKSELKIDLPDELSKPVTPLSDNDNALVYIERILKEIHSIFYEQYDREGQTPNVKHIVSWLRSQVLKGERIVFSGIVPLGIDINSCEIYQLCTQFGAKVGEKIVKGETTVLVAAKAGTEKIRQAKRLRIPVVSVRWLEACYKRWQKLDKRDFLFCEEDCAEFGGSLHSKKPRLSETLCSSTEMDHFSQMDTLDKKALQEMENEVDCALSEDDDDDNEASTSFYTQLKTEKEDQELSVSDNDNNNKFVDDILPNLNEEEDPQEYSKCLDESEIPLNDEEEDEQDYIDYENEHLGEKESSSDGGSEVKQYGKEEASHDDEEVGGQFEKEASYGESDVRQFGDSDTNDLNEDYDEMVADIEQQLNDNK